MSSPLTSAHYSRPITYNSRVRARISWLWRVGGGGNSISRESEDRGQREKLGGESGVITWEVKWIRRQSENQAVAHINQDASLSCRMQFQDSVMQYIDITRKTVLVGTIRFQRPFKQVCKQKQSDMQNLHGLTDMSAGIYVFNAEWTNGIISFSKDYVTAVQHGHSILIR